MLSHEFLGRFSRFVKNVRKDPPTIDSPVSGLKMVSVHGSFPFDDSGQFLVNFRMFLKIAQKGVT